MENTVKNKFKDSRYNIAKTYIINCLGVTEIYTDKEKMLWDWGNESCTIYFLNTRELFITII